jgi:hypothetical protein
VTGLAEEFRAAGSRADQFNDVRQLRYRRPVTAPKTPRATEENMSFKMLSMTSAVAACAAAAAIGSAAVAAAEPAPGDCVTVDAATVCDPSGGLATPPESGGSGSGGQAGGAGGAGPANNQNGVYGPSGDTPPVG